MHHSSLYPPLYHALNVFLLVLLWDRNVGSTGLQLPFCYLWQNTIIWWISWIVSFLNHERLTRFKLECLSSSSAPLFKLQENHFSFSNPISRFSTLLFATAYIGSTFCIFTYIQQHFSKCFDDESKSSIFIFQLSYIIFTYRREQHATWLDSAVQHPHYQTWCWWQHVMLSGVADCPPLVGQVCLFVGQNCLGPMKTSSE